MCYLQVLIYCSFSPEVSVVNLSLVYVLGEGESGSPYVSKHTHFLILESVSTAF